MDDVVHITSAAFDHANQSDVPDRVYGIIARNQAARVTYASVTDLWIESLNCWDYKIQGSGEPETIPEIQTMILQAGGGVEESSDYAKRHRERARLGRLEDEADDAFRECVPDTMDGVKAFLAHAGTHENLNGSVEALVLALAEKLCIA